MTGDDLPAALLEQARRTTLHAGVAAAQGRRSAMEDRVSRVEPFLDPCDAGPGRTAFYAVFDGHNGSGAAEHAAARLHSVRLSSRSAGAAASPRVPTRGGPLRRRSPVSRSCHH